MNEDLIIMLIQLAMIIPFGIVTIWGIRELTKPMFPTEEKK
ncbi:MAG: hypothetical protein PHC64_05775 [Candidatus Gastranaerophilales bacterium]|nr:hypothetical protein [Candidatus Gastranaerophilales bacterium]